MNNERPLTLITGASGKTGSRVVAQLQKHKYPVRLAGRKQFSSVDSRGDYVYFDWYDPGTYGAALKHVTQIYLVVPLMDMNPEKIMIPFIQEAIWSGVKRFVLLGSASVDEQGPIFGKVHQALKELAPEWAVLRPSYFMENFTEGPHRQTIADSGKIYSATGEGRVGFVSADDIAAVAFHTLTDAVPHNTDHIITGPDSLSYAEVAEAVSGLWNQPIQHESISEEILRNQMVEAGMPEEYATLLAGLDTFIKEQGSEDQVTDTVQRITGNPPLSIHSFFSAQTNTQLQE